MPKAVDDRIKSGNHVINWKGRAITAYCGNFINGRASVLFMGTAGRELLTHEASMSRAEVEAMLIGKVIRDPQLAVDLDDMTEELSGLLKRRNQTSGRLRGRIGGEART